MSNLVKIVKLAKEIGLAGDDLSFVKEKENEQEKRAKGRAARRWDQDHIEKNKRKEGRLRALNLKKLKLECGKW